MIPTKKNILEIYINHAQKENKKSLAFQSFFLISFIISLFNGFRHDLHWMNITVAVAGIFILTITLLITLKKERPDILSLKTIYNNIQQGNFDQSEALEILHNNKKMLESSLHILLVVHYLIFITSLKQNDLEKASSSLKQVMKIAQKCNDDTDRKIKKRKNWVGKRHLLNIPLHFPINGKHIDNKTTLEHLLPFKDDPIGKEMIELLENSYALTSASHFSIKETQPI